jgi:DNA-binding transcriptional regulator YiaG
MGKSAYRRSVELATEILGGHDAVAQYLGTTPDMVASWAAGSSEPAINFLLRLVDLIEQKTVAAARAATVVRRRKDEAV